MPLLKIQKILALTWEIVNVSFDSRQLIKLTEVGQSR